MYANQRKGEGKEKKKFRLLHFTYLQFYYYTYLDKNYWILLYPLSGGETTIVILIGFIEQNKFLELVFSIDGMKTHTPGWKSNIIELYISLLTSGPWC